MNATSSTNPATLLGMASTTWVEFGEGRMLLGENSSHANGSTGGAETHTLTTAEMPVHKHIWCGDDQLNINGMNNGISEYGGAFSYDASSGASGDGNYYNTSNTGSGDAHNNMPPYITVYMWKRTA
jgi:microcystin-dependent protein